MFAPFTGSQYDEHFHDGNGEHYGRVFIASEPFGRQSIDLTGHWKILLTCQLFSAVLTCLDCASIASFVINLPIVGDVVLFRFIESFLEILPRP